MEVEQFDEVFTYLCTVRLLLKEASAFTLSRLSVAIEKLIGAIVIASLSLLEIAAAPLIFSLNLMAIGFARGLLLGINDMVARAKGGSDHEQIHNLRKVIPLLVALSTIIGWSIFLLGELYYRYINRVDDLTQNIIDKAIYAYLLVLPFKFIFIADIQFALGLCKSKLALHARTINTAVALATGIPLAKGLVVDEFKGNVGLVSGVVLSSMSVALFVKYYFHRQPLLQRYSFHAKQWRECLQHGVLFKRLLHKGFANGVMAVTEWSNIAILTLLMGALFARDELEAMHPAFQLTILTALLSQGASLAVASLISIMRGRFEKNLNERRWQAARQNLANIKRFSNVSQLVMLAILLPFAATLLFAAKPLSAIFIDEQATAENKSLAAVMTRITSLRLLLDGVRNIQMGIWKGLDKLLKATAVSVMAMTVFGLSLGALAAYELDAASALLWGSVTGIVVACVCNLLYLQYWFAQLDKHCAEPEVGADDQQALLDAVELSEVITMRDAIVVGR